MAGNRKAARVCLKEGKLEIWGRAQREVVRRHKSDWGLGKTI